MNFKTHSDTPLFCSVAPGFLNLGVKIPFLLMFFSKKIFRQKKIFGGQLSPLQRRQ